MSKVKNSVLSGKKLDIVVLGLLYLIAVMYALIFGGTPIGKALYAGAMLTLPPTIYLGLRRPKNWLKIGLGATVFGLLFGMALSYFAEASASWTVVNDVFSFRLFGLNTLEEVLGHGMMALLTFTFYEHFLDDEKVRKLGRKHKLAIFIGIFGIALVILVHNLFPSFFASINYPYVGIGVIAILPLILAVYKHPVLMKKMGFLAVYFFILYFSIELFAVKFDYWLYHGNNYIGWVEILGLRFPFEELFFWMILYAPTIVTYYEYTLDDGK